MKIVVTGGTGFLGQKLVNRLLKEEHEVTVIGRNKEIGERLREKGVIFVQASLEDKEAVLSVCKEKEYIFHCAALSSPWGKYADFYNSNVLGTKNLIEGCKRHNIKRFIHVSTPSIYFEYRDKLNIREEDPLPLKAVNYYAETKLQAELELDKAFQAGMPYIAIRPRALFGPGDTAILPRLIRANEEGGVPIINGGRASIDVTYVENVVEAMLLCMSSPENTLGKKYNITNGEPMELITLLEKLFEKLEMKFNKKQISYNTAIRAAVVMECIHKYLLLGKEPVITKYSIGVLSKSQTLDITAAKKELFYAPKITIEEGLNYFVDWWKRKDI